MVWRQRAGASLMRYIKQNTLNQMTKFALDQIESICKRQFKLC